MPTPEETSVKLAEYSAAQEMLRHYDTLNWQIGAILVAATTILTGLALQSEVIKLLKSNNHFSVAVVLGLPFFSFIILQTWRRWFQRHRQLYNLRNETMHRIELELGMYHHLRVVEADQSSDASKNAETLKILEAAKKKVGGLHPVPLTPA